MKAPVTHPRKAALGVLSRFSPRPLPDDAERAAIGLLARLVARAHLHDLSHSPVPAVSMEPPSRACQEDE
jgi:hypothetical protein